MKTIGARCPKPLFAVALAAGILACARHARADVPGFELGFVPGVGVYPHDGPNPLAWGLGGRAGVTLWRFYAGASVTYYFGGKGIDSTFLVSKHTLLYGLTLGFDLVQTEVWSLRAQLGFGAETANTHGDQSGANIPGLDMNGVTQHGVYVEPGALVLVPLGHVGFVGADAGVLVLDGVLDPWGTPSTRAAFTFHGQVGLKL